MEKRMTRHMVHRYLIPAATGILLLALLGLAVVRLLRSNKTISDELIADQVVKLSLIFKRIDQDCKIIGFEHECNYIDFLTVKSFVGSQVGSMNLAYPHQWKGNYLDDTPTIQEKLYEIVKTKDGYFIVPGHGVKLRNGKVMGKDIIINAHTHMEPLLKDPQALLYNDRMLAAPLSMGGSTFQMVVQEVPLRVSKDEDVQELSQAEGITRVC